MSSPSPLNGERAGVRGERVAGSRPQLREKRLQRAFGLQPKLAAGGINIVALFAAEGGGDATRLEPFQEFLLHRLRRTFPRQTFHLVIRNQVHLRVELLRELRQGFYLIE